MASEHTKHLQNLPPRLTLVTCGSFKSLILGDLPMYSSSDYRTSIPSSDLVTKDRPVIDARIGTRREDAAAGFSVGLIPQLIDVLHVLTEGQVLLSRKIRAARLDESSPTAAIAEPPGRFEIPAGQSGSPTVGTARATGPEDIVFDPGTMPTSTSVIDCPPDPGVEVGGVDTASAGVLESAPPSHQPAMTLGDVPNDPPPRPVTQPEMLESVPPAESTASPLRRDYNFFDELDARLASLNDPTA
jgi:hypothetical protein